ncbi:MAG: hypothetical protein ACYCTE_08300 [Acidimicrobiales bacterium]
MSGTTLHVGACRAGSSAAPEASRRHRGTVGVAAAAGVFGFAALVVLLYVLSAHVVPGNSDGATVVLEGQSLGAGDVTLHHWFLSLDSFWGVDALFYAVAVLLVGVRPELLNLVPAVIAALAVVVGAAMARDGRRGVAGLAGAATVVALIALPTYALAGFWLQGPLHIGTALWCLLAFAALARTRSRGAWVVAVVLFTAGNIGDLQTLAFGVVPAALAGVVAAARRRELRAGAAFVAAAGASVVLALVVRETAKLVGTFVVNKSNPIASHHQMLANLGLAATYGAKLLGLGSSGFGTGSVPGALLGVHVVGLALVVAGVLVASVDLVRGVLVGHPNRGRVPDGSEPWRLDDLLVLAFFGSVAVFVILTPVASPPYARYLTPAVAFGAILAGRLVARLVARFSRRWLVALAASAGAAVLACFAAGAGFTLAGPSTPRPARALGTWLASHDLHSGIGGYWSASIVTVETRGVVRVRPVTALPGGRVVAYTRNSESTWYDGHSFDFLVFNPALDFGDVDLKTATATFGRPTSVTPVNGYLVLSWNHPVTLPHVGP